MCLTSSSYPRTGSLRFDSACEQEYNSELAAVSASLSESDRRLAAVPDSSETEQTEPRAADSCIVSSASMSSSQGLRRVASAMELRESSLRAKHRHSASVAALADLVDGSLQATPTKAAMEGERSHVFVSRCVLMLSLATTQSASASIFGHIFSSSSRRSCTCLPVLSHLDCVHMH